MLFRSTATYAIQPSLSTINEGQVLTLLVQTTDVKVGTILYWSIAGTGFTATDFTSGALTGSGTVAANGQFSFSRTLKNDLLTEGIEVLQIKLFSDAARSKQVGLTANVSVNDTSTTPPLLPPTQPLPSHHRFWLLMRASCSKRKYKLRIWPSEPFSTGRSRAPKSAALISALVPSPDQRLWQAMARSIFPIQIGRAHV